MVALSDVCRCHHEKDDHSGACNVLGCACNRYRGQLVTLKKLSTAEYRSRLSPYSDVSESMCWEATLSAFGIDYEKRPSKSMLITELLSRLRSAGYVISPVALADAMPGVTQDSSYTLAVFTRTHTEDDWVLITPGHVITIRDGEITDTAGRHQTVARRVIFIYRVTDPRRKTEDRVINPLRNPYSHVITWLESPAGVRWSQNTHKAIQHNTGFGSIKTQHDRCAAAREDWSFITSEQAEYTVK